MHARLSFTVGAVLMLAACAEPSPRADRGQGDGYGDDSHPGSAGSWMPAGSDQPVVDVPLVEDIARRLWTLPPVRSRRLQRAGVAWAGRRLSMP